MAIPVPYLVAALARREDRLQELAKKLAGAKGTIFPVKTDMTKEEDIIAAFKWIKENLGPVNILVNNAGVGIPTTLHNGDTEKWQHVINLNVMGYCIATREAVKDMNTSGTDGHIIHINSVVGHKVLDIPYVNIYPASKFAVTALAEALRLELNSLKSKIKITNLSPGLVDTAALDPYGKNEQVKKLKELNAILDSDDIADAVFYILSTPPHVQIQQLTITAIHEDLEILSI